MSWIVCIEISICIDLSTKLCVGLLFQFSTVAQHSIKILILVWHRAVKSCMSRHVVVQMVCVTSEQSLAQVEPLGGYLHYLHQHTDTHTFASLSPLTKVLKCLPISDQPNALVKQMNACKREREC